MGTSANTKGIAVLENVLVKPAAGISEGPKPIFSFGQNLASTQPKADALSTQQPTATKRPNSELIAENNLFKLSTPAAANPTVNSTPFVFGTNTNSKYNLFSKFSFESYHKL